MRRIRRRSDFGLCRLFGEQDKTREECEQKLVGLIVEMKAEIAEMKKAANAITKEGLTKIGQPSKNMVQKTRKSN